MLVTQDEWAAAPDFHVWVDTAVVPPSATITWPVTLRRVRAWV